MERYITTDLPVPDALVAEVLCYKGACKYCITDARLRSDELFLRNVVPGLFEYFGAPVAKVLITALLWLVTAPGTEGESLREEVRCPSYLNNRINKLVRDTLGITSEAPLPVIASRTAIIVCKNTIELQFVDVAAPIEEPLNIAPAVRNINAQQPAEMVGYVRGAVPGSVQGLPFVIGELQVARARTDSNRRAFDLAFADIMKKLGALEQETKRMRRMLTAAEMFQRSRDAGRMISFSGGSSRSHQPHPSVAAVGDSSRVQLPAGRPAQLVRGSKLRSLGDLWLEYEIGLDGNKPAKLFTIAEKGMVSSLYSFRKIFWSVMEKLLQRGHTLESALGVFERVHGSSSSITTIIRELKKERLNGGCRVLRV